jgi:tryptophan synthase alpha chain
METKVTNRINKVFAEKSTGILSVYFTAGFPKMEDTLTIATALENAGADIIEIGMPFSDPIADGPTIQDSNTTALNNGMSLEVLFQQLQELRQSVTIPVILMGYINPVLQYGVEEFCRRCDEVGIDGLILPDLPMSEYLEEYKGLFESYGLKNIFLITPQTAESRIRKIDENTNGFIYMVSTAAVTGSTGSFGEEQKAYFRRIRDMQLMNPLLVGFGISNHESFTTVNEYANGAIIGSAFIRLLKESQNLTTSINKFIQDIKQPS